MIAVRMNPDSHGNEVYILFQKLKETNLKEFSECHEGLSRGIPLEQALTYTYRGGQGSEGVQNKP